MTKITIDDKEYIVNDVEYNTTDNPNCMFMDFICDGNMIVRYETKYDEETEVYKVVKEPYVIPGYVTVETEEFPF